jgi:hypothetical protein
MKISLRKANALQMAVNESIKNLEFNQNIILNEFQDPAKELEVASKKFAANINRRFALFHALYDIRKSVSNANTDKGISETLADIAHLEKDIVFFGNFSKTAVSVDLAVINGKLEKMRNRADTADAFYHDQQGVSTTIFTHGELAGFATIVKTAKKQKQKLQDELLELNIRTEVELSETVVSTLTAEGLL